MCLCDELPNCECYEQGRKDNNKKFQLIINKVRKQLCEVYERNEGCKNTACLCNTCDIIEQIEELMKD